MKLRLFIITSSIILLMQNSYAASLYNNEPPKDTDLDGLTDQGEINLFHTDPNDPDTDKDGFLDSTEVIVGTNPLDKADPEEITQVATEPNQAPTPWTWYLIRTSGITSYILMFLLIMSGMGITSGYIFNFFGPIIAWRIHRTIAITLTAFIATHVTTLLLDKFISFSLSDVFIPFHSEYEPLYLSLGIIGFYLFILIILTSIFLITSRYKLWKLIHYLTYPTFVALFIHGVFLGTDSDTLAMQIVYWTTGVLAAIAFIYRLTKINIERPKLPPV